MKSLIKRFLFLFFIFTAFATVDVSAQECTNPDDEAIVNSMLSKISKNSSLKSQMSHINVISVDGVVKIQGWVKTKSDFEKVQDFAIETDCVRLVNVNGFEDSEPEGLKQGCSGGTKPCGDICIPDNDTCNIGKTRS
jgi:hypothetical protein